MHDPCVTLRKALATGKHKEAKSNFALFVGILGGGMVDPAILVGGVATATYYRTEALFLHMDAREAVQARLAQIYTKWNKPPPTGRDVTDWMYKTEVIATALRLPPPRLHQRLISYVRGDAYAPSTQPQRG